MAEIKHKEKIKGKSKEREILIDAENATLGRLASYVAKQALLGKRIVIVNSEKAIITGNRKSIIEDYMQKRRRHGTSQKGPIFQTSAERILKRTIRGMLPHREGRGREALKRIKCYKGIPSEYVNVKKISSGKEKTGKKIELERLSLMLKGK